jgi:hypothetical protein
MSEQQKTLRKVSKEDFTVFIDGYAGTITPAIQHNTSPQEVQYLDLEISDKVGQVQAKRSKPSAGEADYYIKG